jgi:GNAT superfamily N-acetyltransferase
MPSKRPTRKKLKLVVTVMEMRTPQHRAATLPLGAKAALLRLESPTVSFYRYLYNTVGEQAFWYERRRLDDKALAALLADPGLEIYVLYAGGVPAGFAELDLRRHDEIELAHFGLIPEFLGHGFADFLLGWAVDEAWRRTPKRVWLRATNFDHPTVLAAYQKAGFLAVEQETRLIDDPRATGLIPKSVPVPHAALAE